ncbi:MAG: phytanoyl-CoA dioxygenase family protein [Gemmatimonadales bacterium]|nr:MAG: phytanoyl-CoA dioxygenase family protein [Gemmatimonadales bacterium]
MNLENFDRNADTGDIVAALNRDGGVIVREQVDADIANAVLAELREHFDTEGTESQGDFNGYKTLRLSGILARSRTSAALLGHSRVMEVADSILLPHCINYQIGSTTAIEIYPGEVEQRLHADDVIYPIHIPGLPIQISAMWALDDITIENGATRLMVNSHRAREPFPLFEGEIVQAPMSKGSVLYYLGSTVHGGGANRTDKPRAGLINTYSVGWLKSEVNHFMTIPRDVAESYPEHIQRLLGYQSHGLLLGGYPGDPDGYWPKPHTTRKFLRQDDPAGDAE